MSVTLDPLDVDEPLVPEGSVPPAHIPPEIFIAALDAFLAGRRLDMQALAADLGISRSTLYRKVGGRDQLLGAVLWYLTRRVIVSALAETEHLRGVARILAVVGRLMMFVDGQPALQGLLEAEPEAALRVLTSREGPVQGPLVKVTERLLEREERGGALELSIDRHTLAYIMVRIGESFLYSDVIADNEPDLELAMTLIGRLLREGRAALPGLDLEREAALA